jgi:hypothetical protein
MADYTYFSTAGRIGSLFRMSACPSGSEWPARLRLRSACAVRAYGAGGCDGACTRRRPI